MKYTKLFALLLVSILALGGLATVAAQDTMPAVTITIWSQEDPSRETVLQTEFQAWADEYAPGSTLDLVHKDTETQRNDVNTACLAGTGLPDLILSPNDSIGVFVDAGCVQALDDLFDMSLYPFNIGAAQIAGETYGVPTDAGNHLMLMFNKTFVKEAPDTWDDLITVAHQVEKDNPGVHGFDYNQNEAFWFLPFVHGFGGSTYDADGNMTLDTEAWVNAYQFVHDLKYGDNAVLAKEGCDYNCADGAFKEGKTAMIINGIWALGGYLDTTASPALGADNLGLAPWPTLPNGERPKPFTAGKFLSIPVTVEGDQLDAVVAFATWLTTDPDAVTAFALGTNNLPAIEAVKVDAKKDPLLAEAGDILTTGVGMPAASSLRCMWDSVKPNLEGVMNDTLAAADAATEAQTAADDCLASS
jgi:arabinogalactan oligomer/maltooligosaccharide transport system substrate-binding protein